MPVKNQTRTTKEMARRRSKSSKSSSKQSSEFAAVNVEKKNVCTSKKLDRQKDTLSRQNIADLSSAPVDKDETATHEQLTNESAIQECHDLSKDIDYSEQMIKDKEGFLAAYRAHKNSSVEFTFEDVIATKNRELLETLWDTLNTIATECALDMFPNDPTEEDLLQIEESQLTINGILLVGRLTIEDPRSAIYKEKLSPPPGLTQTALLLHGILPSISSKNDTVKNNIAKLCELWHAKHLPDSDSLVANTLPYILHRATGKNASQTTGGGPTKADVKRVYSMQSAILDHNIADSSSRVLRELLLEAAQSALFFKTPEGVRFLAFLFTISPAFIPYLHASIKKIIPGSSASMSSAIGEVYYKAWRSCEGTFKTNIEELCIQDLMQRAILAKQTLPKNLKVFMPIRHILKVMHRAKNDRQVQAMLCKLYEPILWRHLKVANSQARANAAQLFFDAFPVEDPNVQAEERSLQQEIQVQIMCDLLKDESAEVRIISVAGASLVIAKYWLILSSTDLNKLVKIFVIDLAVDASSPQVRTEVLKGFKHILTACVRSHLYLKKILPKIRDSLHDIKDCVRQAMVDLLSAVSNVKMIKYWDICPLDHILARLEVEKSTIICTKIVDLIFNSFFPVSEDEDTKIRRCIYLIQQNQTASRKFYNFCPKFIPMHNQVKFMLAILVALKRNIKMKFGLKTKHAGTEKSLSQNTRYIENNDNARPGDSENTSDVESEGDKENDESVDGSFAGKKRKRKRLYTQPNKSVIMNTSPSVIPPQEYTQSNTLSQDSSMERSMSLESSINHSLGLDDTSLVNQTEQNQVANEAYIEELENEKIVGALLDVVCILWMARSTDIVKEQNIEYRSLLEKKTSKLVSVLFKFYRSSDVSRSLIYLCSFLPHSSVVTMAGFCLSQLRNAKSTTDDDSNSPSVGVKLQLDKIFDAAWTGNQSQAPFDQSNPLPTYIDALCNWSRGDDILELVTNWISRDLRERQVNSRKSVGTGRNRSNASRKGVRFSESAGLGAAKPDLALQLIKYMFRHPVNREILLRKNRPQVQELKDTLRKYVDETLNYLPTPGEFSFAISDEHLIANQKFLCEVWQSLLTITMLLHSPQKIEPESDKNNKPQVRESDKEKGNKSRASSNTNTTGQTETDDVFIILEDLLEWSEEHLITLPQLIKDTFSLRLLNSLVNACSNAVTLNIADINFIGLSLEFASNILDNLEKSHMNISNELTNMTDAQKETPHFDFEDTISACLKPISRYVIVDFKVAENPFGAIIKLVQEYLPLI